MLKLLITALAGFFLSTAHAELPDLGEPEPVKVWPAVAIAVSAVLIDQNVKACGYPCNHYTHIAAGAGLSYAVSSFYGTPTAWGVGVAYSLGTEIYGKYAKDKSFRMKDVAGRGLGTGLGIWLSHSF